MLLNTLDWFSTTDEMKLEQRKHQNNIIILHLYCEVELFVVFCTTLWCTLWLHVFVILCHEFCAIYVVFASTLVVFDSFGCTLQPHVITCGY